MQSGLHRASIASLCTLALLALASCKSREKKGSAAAAALKPMNVVVITLDTVRADHLHCYGYQNIQTPNIDTLAKQGVQFDKAVAQTPLTLPSHASMFTGTNPNVNHVRDNGGFALQSSSVALATILQRHGWDTAAYISSIVLKKVFGLNQGFAEYDDRMPETKGGQELAARPANITVDHAIRWLNSRSDKPFFIWIHFYDAHQPYKPPPQFRKAYPGNPYDAEIAFEDQQLGRFIDAVRKKSPANRTLIALLSDHGQSLGEHGEYEHGIFLYDATIRIAWIMAGPGIPAGVHVQQQAREIDLLPTILDLLGGKASSAVQGTSLVPSFSAKPVATTYSYEETLVPKIDMGWSELRGIHTAHWMYVKAPRPELYNLDQDPGELNNIIASHPREYRELNAQLKMLSRSGNNQIEKVATNPVDQATMKQLQSLGYVSGFSTRNIELNGNGDDSKDHTATLKVLETIANSHKLSAVGELQLLQQALKNDPANPTLYGWLIDAYEKLGKYPQAMRACMDARHHGIKSGEIYSRMARINLREGNLEEAISYYQKATQLNPLNVTGQTDLATAYLQTGRLADAERTFHWALAIQDDVPAYNGLGIIAMKQQHLAAARKDFERALQLDPNYVEANLNLGILCTQTDDFPCARHAFKVFLAQAPAADYKDMIPRVKYALGRMDHSGK